MADNESSIQPWSTISREEVADCRVFKVERVRRRSPEGKESDFFTIGSKDWVNVVGLTVDRQVVLIRQYRHGTDEITLEIPGGILDEGESPIDAARRELLEETGYVEGKMRLIGRVRSNPALFDNWQYTVLATDLVPSGSTTFDEHEEIEIDLQPIEAVDDLIRRGAITHAMVIDAFMWYKLFCEGPEGC